MWYREYDDDGNKLTTLVNARSANPILSEMVESVSYAGAKDIALARTKDIEKRNSTTFFYGEKGDEIAEYSYNYKLSTDVIKSTSYMWYQRYDDNGAKVIGEMRPGT